MNASIIGLQQWFRTPPGRYMLAWEAAQFDAVVEDCFGFHAVQLGLPELPALRMNRMPHRWLALPVAPGEGAHAVADDEAPLLPECGEAPAACLVTDPAALPFPEASLDLVVLPHALELSADPHQVLREVERVLVPEGRVVISGLNPASLWGWRQGRARLTQWLGLGGTPYLPEVSQLIGPWRLRDWTRLLGLDIALERYGCYRPAVCSDQWLARMAWFDRVGPRWWPILGAVYFFVAIKRVHGMRLVGPAWRARQAASASPVPVARRQ
jgi:SAM-dependent methyltransferase